MFLEAPGFLDDTLEKAPWVINTKYNEGLQDGSAGKGVAAKPKDHSSIPGTHTVDGESLLLQLIL